MVMLVSKQDKIYKFSVWNPATANTHEFTGIFLSRLSALEYMNAGNRSSIYKYILGEELSNIENDTTDYRGE